MRRTLLLALVLALSLAVPALAQQTYTTQATLAVDAAWIQRVQIAIVKVAIDDIGAESDQITNHATRLALAKKVVENPERWARLLAWGVAADMTVTANTSDAAIFSRVLFIWNSYASP